MNGRVVCGGGGGGGGGRGGEAVHVKYIHVYVQYTFT